MKQEQPHIIEAEYYPDGNQKRYYKKVEQPYPQVFQLIIGLCAVAIAMSGIAITFYSSQNQCYENYNQASQPGLHRSD
jgi:hypothetical protein